MATLLDAEALHVSGRILKYQEFLGPMTPQSGILEACFKLDRGELKVRLNPELGESVRAFNRRFVTMGTNGLPTGDAENTAVIEIVPDPDKPTRFVRIYIGREITLSTVDQ